MSPKAFAIADTCFLIDWARYRGRDILFKLFKTVFIPEEVLGEIKSEATITWIAENLATDRAALYTSPPEEVDEARRLVEQSRLYPHLPAIDLPEALCLVAGRRRGYVVLTENRGALYAPKLVKGYGEVVVWRALEILLNAALTGVVEVDCENPLRLFREYESYTLHIFPSKALKKALERLRGLCGGKA